MFENLWKLSANISYLLLCLPTKPYHMIDALLVQDFLQPIDRIQLMGDEELNEAQLGSCIQSYTDQFPDLELADVVLLGIGEERGTGNGVSAGAAPVAIRKKLYQLYNWHKEVLVADIGDVQSGATLQDTYAAAKTVIAELLHLKKSIVIIGGSHDLTLAQYGAYVQHQQIIEASCIDALIDLGTGSSIRSENFLMEMLTGDPNYIRQYNHLGFQIYYAHPNMLQTMDKLRFDCFRLGVVKDKIEEMEPVLRSSDMVSIDIASIASAYAPSNRFFPNGFNGEEICTLTRFAGLSDRVTTLGIYGYNTRTDIDELTAMQAAQMIWYYIDGKSKSKTEAQLSNRNAFNEYHTLFADVDTLFLQSKKTGRWWMQLPNQKFIPCSAADYRSASLNEIPERWLRAQERE
jgi:formiminoglutamase